MKKPKAQDDWNKKQGPTEMLAEVERLKAAGKMPTLEQVLDVIAEVRKEYRQRILDARHGVRRNRF